MLYICRFVNWVRMVLDIPLVRVVARQEREIVRLQDAIDILIAEKLQTEDQVGTLKKWVAEKNVKIEELHAIIRRHEERRERYEKEIETTKTALYEKIHDSLPPAL